MATGFAGFFLFRVSTWPTGWRAAHAGSRGAVIYLLDTNILIYLIKNQPPAIAQRVDALPNRATNSVTR